MARADIGSAKYQSKQLKALGLQKLRYYCQLCQKQCRDANGFKNHLGSPSHLGRVSNLSEAGKGSSVIEEFLRQFESEFLALLRVNHGTKKISANKFYQEYILNDKNHVHMNATRWSSLTLFVKYLGTSGKVRVEIPEDSEDEFNLFIKFVDPVSEASTDNRARSMQTEEDRLSKFLEAQIERGRQIEKAAEERQNNADDKPTQPLAPSHNTVLLKKPVAISLKGIGGKKNQKKSAFGGDSDDE